MRALLFSWFVCGVVAIASGFLGLLYPLLSLLLVFPLRVFLSILQKIFFTIKKLAVNRRWSEVSLIVVVAFIWLLHLSGVFVPETGFDAVWYHLPIVDQFVDHHRIIYLPEYYQSVNPLFSDLLFLLGYQVGGGVGAKLVAYGLALSLILVSYGLARVYLNRFWSLLFVIQVSLIQVVTWQAASFYVDVAKAMWELGALYLLLENREQKLEVKNILLSALFFGATLATKQFSLLLLPALLLIVYLRSRKNIVVTIYWLLIALVMPLPFYVHSWINTDNPFFSINLHLAKVDEIGGSSSLLSHLFTQLLSLPQLLWHLLFEARDYISPLLLLLTPFAYLEKKALAYHWPLLIFSLGQFLVWWFVPPLSTRYALSGFITLLLLLCIATVNWVEKNPKWYGAIVGGILIISGFLLLPRLYVFTRHWPYLVGRQTKAEYLPQFFDGNIDDHLVKWHLQESSPTD